MARFGIVPHEVPVQRSLDLVAPLLKRRVLALMADPRVDGGREEWLFETLRTKERQEFLYGFGREYDDGRGVVTRIRFNWHMLGLAVDIVEKDATPWEAPPGFWHGFGDLARNYGLAWGGLWKDSKGRPAPDLPHVQLLECPVAPTDDDIARYRSGGLVAVWEKYGAAA